MRPVKLVLQALGPYGGCETIDFTKLESRTMFVISGKTGAGKTTIFDAICYAIYGKASNDERNATELRSQFAAEDVSTEVSFVFTLRNQTYEITRSPQQEKKKARGDGFTTIGAKAELSQLSAGKKRLLAANVRDTDEKIKEIMMIDCHQFRQIVMIPQGEFRKLLTSDSKEKEIILQRLFHTEIYKKVEEILKEEASELKRELEILTHSRINLLHGIHAVLSNELAVLIDEKAENHLKIIPLLDEEISAMKTELDKLGLEQKEKQKQRDRLQKQLFDGEAIVKQLKAKDEVRQKKEQLEGKRESINQKEQVISLAKKAMLLAYQEEICHRLKKEATETETALKQINRKAEQAEKDLCTTEEQYQKEKNREEERNNITEEINRLNSLEADVRSMDEVKKAVESGKSVLSALKKQKANCESDLSAIEQQLQELAKEQEKESKGKFQLLELDRLDERLQFEARALEKYEQNLHDLQNFKEEEKKLQALDKQTSLRLKDAYALEKTLEDKWMNGQAAHLATVLKEGEACPVCGSIHHPRLAVAKETNFPAEEDLKTAAQQAKVLEEEKKQLEIHLVKKQSAIQSLKHICGELLASLEENRHAYHDRDLQSMKAILANERLELVTKQENIKRFFERMQKNQPKHELAEKKHQDLQQQKEHLQKQINEAGIRLAKNETALARIIKLVPGTIQNVSDFEKQLINVKTLHLILQKSLEDAQQKHQHARERYGKEQARFEMTKKQYENLQDSLAAEREKFLSEMNKQGFSQYKAYAKAKMAEKEIQQTEKEIRQYHEEYRSVSDRFHELTQLLQGVTQPDLTAIQTELKNLDNEITKLQRQYTNLMVKKNENEEIFHKLQNILNEINQLEQRYRLIGHLYDITKGQNTYRITFERFVLAAFLDDILQEANVRLLKMTGGRYQLLRKEERSKGNAQSGLELLVFDQYTGQNRHVKTLSGGESFKASLALALGLADVVQSYAGGVSLETMFIDEGFGTLDAESLEQAIETLMDIQSSGRLVGVISHVAELKERIDARLEVYSSQSGSRTEFHFFSG
ncbi:AAA family ATPase [Bacillaceae bacterium Marseille-Q3522]|nr:AAA family ATPase [Bacillaceae bacterium Marseille-Q3522]